LSQQEDVFFTLRGVADTMIDCTGVTFIGSAHTAMLEVERFRRNSL
jgi:anti-anti-sigma regulatory factor